MPSLINFPAEAERANVELILQHGIDAAAYQWDARLLLRWNTAESKIVHGLSKFAESTFAGGIGLECQPYERRPHGIEDDRAGFAVKAIADRRPVRPVSVLEAAV